MFLEQVILKYNAASTCINIKDIHEVGACYACCVHDNPQYGLPERIELASRRCIISITGTELISVLDARTCASGMLATLLFAISLVEEPE
jgi:hypothetical protein